MLLESYTKEIFRAECNPSFESVHCIAHLDQDIGPVLPYLNSVLGGYTYSDDPPSVGFKAHGKLIAVYPDRIAVNALRDENEAEQILDWLRREINSTWDGRADIKPSHAPVEQPQVMNILKLLPKTNCGECRCPTCMVFAVQVAEGGRTPEECPDLTDDNRQSLEEYLARFEMDI
jgi:ArsR family metal-binding transcriptional regulator